MVDQTNAYAQHNMSHYTKSHSLYRSWYPVTVIEMKAFVGVILNMGIIQLKNLRDYWSTSTICNIPFFPAVFPRDRFFPIFGMLHVGGISSPSKKAKIQPFINILLPIITSNFTPYREVAVDESVIKFKGRVSFKQYLKGKPNPWGVKAYVLSDSKTGYMHNVIVYFGKQTNLIDKPEWSHTVKVVVSLVEHDLYTDRFYTSPILADSLQQMNITLTGTVMSNKRGVPLQLKTKNKTSKGSIESYRCEDMMASSWMEKKKVTDAIYQV